MATLNQADALAPLKVVAQETVLRRLQIGNRAAINRSVCADNVLVDVVRATSDELAVELIAYVWGKIDNEERYSHPKTWWDAFKVRWFPKWALKRWPAQFTDITVARGGAYPMLAGQPGVGYQTLYVMNALRGSFR